MVAHFAQIPLRGTLDTLGTLSDIRSINNGDNQVDAIKEGLKWENIK